MPRSVCAETTIVATLSQAGRRRTARHRLIAVANSNRFTSGQAGTVSILDYHKALSGAGSSATVGTFVAGDFPRQCGLSNNERFLYPTEFSSNVAAIFPTRNLIKDVRTFDPVPGIRATLRPLHGAASFAPLLASIDGRDAPGAADAKRSTCGSSQGRASATQYQRTVRHQNVLNREHCESAEQRT